MMVKKIENKNYVTKAVKLVVSLTPSMLEKFKSIFLLLFKSAEFVHEQN